MDTGTAPTKPVVLLVEDDPSVARFVEMALDRLPVTVQVRPCVESAIAWLLAHRAVLVITDLMMPGESGADLLRRLQATPALAAGARVVVLSAGLDQAVRSELLACGAWRTLDKPVAVSALEGCVREALAGCLPDPVPEASAPGAGTPQDEASSDAARQAIREYFCGDSAMFHQYRSACLAQFLRDAEEGDRAVECCNLPALRRLGHSLASVLRTLGRPDDALVARQVEQAALQGRPDALRGLWNHLRARLTAAG